MLHGLAAGTLFVRIPDLRDAAGLGDGGLGLVLAALGAGAIVAMPVAGGLTARHGSAWTMRLLLPPLAVALAVVGQLDSPVALAAGTFAFGCVIGGHDVAMNAHGVTVEGAARRPILSGLHAAFSAGALLGSGLGALATSADVGANVHLAALAPFVLLGGLAYRRLLPPETDRQPARQAHEPRPSLAARLAPLRTPWLLACAVAALGSFVAENSVTDWSGVLLRDHRDASPGVAALGVFAFSAAMTVGRLTGDRTVARYGDRATLTASGAVAAVGWLVVALVDDPWAAIAAWVLTGLALANAVPIVFRAAGTPRPARDGRPGPTATQGLSLVVGLGYAGGLLGPAVLGGLAEVVGLPTAMLLPAALAALVVLLAPVAAAPTDAAAEPATGAAADAAAAGPTV
nr:MFS transporter [Patulibacter sp. SYSU D01012]